MATRTVDLGNVVGPAGPNQVTASTATNIAGLLKGNGDKVGAATAGDDYVAPSDLTDIRATGSTNGTGATISAGRFFYLNNVLVQAKTDIASGATFTNGTNYEAPTAGALNALKSAIMTDAGVVENYEISPETGFGGGKFYATLFRNGTVQYSMYCSKSSIFGTDVNMFVLPSALRPTVETERGCFVGKGSSQEVGRLRFRTDGGVRQMQTSNALTVYSSGYYKI